jgi:hypothetical protein
MTGDRPLFPPDQLVSEETRGRWRERLAYLKQHEGMLDDYQATFVGDWLVRIKDGKDMNFNQSSFLNRAFHKVEEAVG